MPKDRKGTTVFKRKKRLVPTSGGKKEVRVGFPSDLEARRNEQGWLAGTFLLLEDSIFFFDYAGWSVLSCPFCAYEFPPEDIRGLSSWTCACGADVQTDMKEDHNMQTYLIHNYDPTTGLVVTSLPDNTNKIAPHTGLATLIFNRAL